MAEKQRVHGERYPIDEDFLAALATMPPASGVALGFDRLVMLATGAPRIEQVIWTPVPNADVRASGRRAASKRSSLETTAAADPAKTLTSPHGTGRGRPPPPEKLAELRRVAARYAVAITPGDGRR